MVRADLRFAGASARRVFFSVFFYVFSEWCAGLDSNFTSSVPRLDILFRRAHIISQSGFESCSLFRDEKGCASRAKISLRSILCAGLDSNQRCPLGRRFTVSWNSRYPTGALYTLENIT